MSCASKGSFETVSLRAAAMIGALALSAFGCCAYAAQTAAHTRREANRNFITRVFPFSFSWVFGEEPDGVGLKRFSDAGYNKRPRALLQLLMTKLILDLFGLKLQIEVCGRTIDAPPPLVG